jgi:hypothetical protein
MSPQSNDKPAPDFSNYLWVPGAWRGDAACVSTSNGRTFLGVKGRDRKTGHLGYVSIELTPDGLAALRQELLAVLAQQPLDAFVEPPVAESTVVPAV